MSADVWALSLLALTVFIVVLCEAWRARDEGDAREYSEDWGEFVKGVTALAKARRKLKTKRHK